MIREGKRYWRRDGCITSPARMAPGDGRYEVANLIYFSNGKCAHQNSANFELVAEYEGPELVLPTIFEEGRRYITKTDWITPPCIRVVRRSGTKVDGLEFPCVHSEYPDQRIEVSVAYIKSEYKEETT